MSLLKISNRDFLAAIYGEPMIGNGWVASFVVSPTRAEGRHWGGRAYEIGSALDLNPHANNYFSVALLLGSARQKATFLRLPCIVLDDPDVGALALPPSWVLGTSPGKHQVGYILVDSPETYDVVMCDRALSAFIANGLIAKDKSGNNTVRYCRLPVGTNTKYNPPFAHVLHQWNPEQRYAIAEVLGAYGVPPIEERPPIRESAEWDPLEVNVRLDVAEATRQMVSGESIHDPSMRMLASNYERGVPDGVSLEWVGSLIRASGDDPERVQARVRDLPRMLRDWQRKHPQKSPQAIQALELRTTKDGVIIADEENVLRILMRWPQLQGIVRFDEFASEMILARPITDNVELVSERGVPRPWTDADTVSLQTFIQRFIVPRIGRDKIEAVVAMYAREHCRFHPVLSYLQSLTWDQIPRLDTWLPVYMGADEQPHEYLAAVGARWLLSAVARIMEPGCQVDNVLVLEGPQGILKSTALRTLASDLYFSDSLPADLSHKDARDHLRGKWIVELPELAQFKRAEIETIKGFITRRYEQYRPSYGRNEIKFPRQAVFAGTTNVEEYLVDVTGNRRFWGVSCKRIDIDALRRDRDQLWAEAVARYRTGEPWHLTGELVAVAAKEAQARVAHDPWTATVLSALENEMPTPTIIAPGEVLELMSLPTIERHGRNAARVAQILRDLGWRKGKRHMSRGQLYERAP